MENEVKAVVEAYIHMIHTQDKEEFLNVWSLKDTNTLISIGREFRGPDTIYNDFVIGGIQKAYSVIDLINDGLDIRFLSDDTAVAVFRYHTECIRRESGEPFSISGLETQIIRRNEQGNWKLEHVHYSKV